MKRVDIKGMPRGIWNLAKKLIMSKRLLVSKDKLKAYRQTKDGINSSESKKKISTSRTISKKLSRESGLTREKKER